ncbi:probable Dol-P-Man:Man(7)GlcNAc(2)-PP-Dol alpha-1,6-mannosyltransferase [Aplysia californica]|uniref:Mannosyltransferase n=1 Tax=Aplysia californica TaxID=6500 RepID=A0ABM0JLM0_APLCA|nr:probable Dol-P-Man:Man(7)GlcNAc(2)-PP-Dol alpha-1,6-mannosyltransferase [Aplysia californica]
MDKLLEASVIFVMLVHLFACPYTKVEESFNMQATHDILNFGLDIDKYDHLEFPGVVPRSFIGPLCIAAVSSPFVLLNNITGGNKLVQQYITRAVLGQATSLSFFLFCNAIESGFGKNVKRWLILITMTQFHFMFYMSRPLPNIFALSMVLLALTSWLHQKHKLFIWLSGAAVVLFRFELVMFLGPILLQELAVGRLKFPRFLKTTMLAGCFWLGLTVLVDSFFWQRWLWPEGEVMWFNVVLNKSSDWGTSPFLWYFYSVLPRALSATVILIPVGVYLTRQVTVLLWPALGYILLFSFLPHKELRFILYTFPVLNTVAACALATLWRNKEKSLSRRFLALGSSSLLLGNVLLTTGFLYIAHYNYPGGAALRLLHQLEENNSDVHVHIDVFTAQTGVTRFGQLRDDWIYNKTEDLAPGGVDMQSFTHLLIGAPSEDSHEVTTFSQTHSVQAKVEAFERIKFDKNLLPPLQLSFTNKCFLLKKNTVGA